MLRGVRVNDILTKAERKAVEAENRRLIKLARKMGINPTNEEKSQQLATLLLRAIATKQDRKV